MGGHLVHLLHWLGEETEKGGAFAGVGIVAGRILGCATNPVMHPSELCETKGLGEDALGQCPDVFDPERLIVVLFVGAVFGAVAIVVGYLVAGGHSSE
jgi:hypothetical protein